MSKKEKIWWGIFLIFAIIAILSSFKDIYTLLSAIGSIAFFALIISTIVWIVNRKKNPNFAHKYVRYIISALCIMIVALVASAPFYKGSSQQKEDIAESRSDKKDSENSSIKDSEKKVSSEKASSSKAESVSESKKEDAEVSSAKAKNEKSNKKDFDKKLQSAVDGSSGTIKSIDDEDGTITIILSNSATDDMDDSQLKQACLTAYHSINDLAQEYRQDNPYIIIQDEDANTIARTTITGGFKYKGLGN